MRSYKDIGIPFKQVNINEADTIYSILTKHHGRIDAIAKGIRKIQSRKAGNMDLMTLSKFAFARGKSLDIITEVELLDDFASLKKQLQSTFSLFFLSELIDKFVQSGEQQRVLFSLLRELLMLMQKDNSMLFLQSFEMKLLEMQGFKPNLITCLVCGRTLKQKEKHYLSYDQPGFVCEKDKQSYGIVVSDTDIKILRFLLTKNLADSIKLKCNQECKKRLKKIIHTWLQVVAEREIKAEKYID